MKFGLPGIKSLPNKGSKVIKTHANDILKNPSTKAPLNMRKAAGAGFKPFLKK